MLQPLQPSDILSENFRAYEFAIRVGQTEVLPEDPEVCANLARLACEGLQPLRNAWQRHLIDTMADGSPVIQVVCGWRSLKHNRDVGGAEKSQHILGLAADIACDVNWRALRRGLGTVRDAERMEMFAHFADRFIGTTDKIGGFGVYTSIPGKQHYWIHVDMRPRVLGHVYRWTGHHVGSEQ